VGQRVLNATIIADVPVYDNERVLNLHVNMVWSAKPGATPVKFHYLTNNRSPDGTFFNLTRGSFVEATALGTVSDGKVNYTPNPSNEGGIGRNSDVHVSQVGQ
jgi:hypothetical protein